MFHVERSQQVLKNSFFLKNQRMKPSRAQKDIVGTYSTSFWKVGVFLAVRSPIIFWKVRTKNIKTVAYKTKRRRPRFRNERIKNFFKSIRYRKTSQTQDVKSQSTKRSLRELAQPKRDSAFEQIKRIVPSRETSGSSQNIIFSYNQRKNQSRAQTDVFGTYSTSFWKVSVLLKKQTLFISIRYHKTSQTQDVKSQSTKRSLRSLAQPKRDTAFEQKDVLCQVERSEEVLKTIFLVTTKETNPAELRKTFLERTHCGFGKFPFCSRKKSCFYKYSISQDISNPGFKEPKHQT